MNTADLFHTNKQEELMTLNNWTAGYEASMKAEPIITNRNVIGQNIGQSATSTG